MMISIERKTRWGVEYRDKSTGEQRFKPRATGIITDLRSCFMRDVT